MSLIPCPECGRKISSSAEACPQCGHPGVLVIDESTPPPCYRCRRSATTRCQRCNVMSCAEHVESAYVRHGRGGANELLCHTCLEARKSASAVGVAVFLFLLAVILLSLLIAAQKQAVGIPIHLR